MNFNLTIENNTSIEGHVRTYMIKDVTFYVVNNIIDYKFNDGFLDRWEVTSRGGGEEAADKNYYFIIDTNFHEATSHWVIESAVFLPYFKELKKEFPTLKLLLKSEKLYKYLFANFFDIQKNDILYEPEPNRENTAFFSPPIQSQNNPKGDKDCMKIYENILKHFYNMFDQFQEETTDEVDYVILPRQKKENYRPNDRHVSYANIIDYIENSGSVYSKIIVNTDDITDLRDQLKAVRKGKTIILTEGAATIINSLFCRNKILLVIGEHMKNLTHRFPCAKLLFDFLMERNTIYCFMNENGIVDHIKEHQKQTILKEN